MSCLGRYLLVAWLFYWGFPVLSQHASILCGSFICDGTCSDQPACLSHGSVRWIPLKQGHFDRIDQL